MSRSGARKPATEFTTDECVTFDPAIDPSYPPSMITENLLRSLVYEGLPGVAEFVAWIIRSAGARATFSLRENPSKSQISAECSQIDASCIENNPPADFPMQKASYAKRVVSLLNTVTKSLNDAENEQVLQYLVRLVAGLSNAHLQSLRFTALLFASYMAEHLSEEPQEILVKAIALRCGDVNVKIRKQALVLLKDRKVDATKRALNDENSEVRITAIKSLTSLSFCVDRIVEMAIQDVALNVRRAAWRFMLNHFVELNNAPDEVWKDIKNFVLSAPDDSLSEKIAGELLVLRMDPSSQTPTQLLLEASSIEDDEAFNSEAIAMGLIRQVKDVKWPQETVKLLLTESNKRVRTNTRASAAKARETQALAAALADDSVRWRLLRLLKSFIALKCSGSSDIVSSLPMLLTKFASNTRFLANIISLSQSLPFGSIITSSSDGEQTVTEYVTVIRELFEDRTELTILVEISSVFSVLPDAIKLPLVTDLHHHFRIKLAELLGPTGTQYVNQESTVDTIANKLAVIAELTDVSDLLKLPLWPAVHANQSVDEPNAMCELVCNIAWCADAAGMQLVAKKLAECTPPLVDRVLKIYTVAKMRSLELTSPLPIDISEHPPTDESVWRSAVASGVI